MQGFGYIADVEVVDPKLIEVNDIWPWPDTRSKSLARRELQEHNILQVDRYSRWVFQKINSPRDGLIVGSSSRHWSNFRVERNGSFLAKRSEGRRRGVSIRSCVRGRDFDLTG